jgi:DNA (cytosine-5)-methyltransferase 1
VESWNYIDVVKDGAPMEATVASLYCGAGGLDLGFALAGFRIRYANDSDPVAVETYNRLFKRLDDELSHLEGGHEAVAGDIDAVSLPESGDAEVVIGGPPCQGFSVAGRMDPSDPRSRHVRRFLDVVDRISPRAFVMENVKALAENRRWTGLLDDLRTRAERLGYRTELHILKASDFGVPQARERMFLVGLADGRHIAPSLTTRDNPPTLRSVLSRLPEWGSPGNDTICTARVTPAKAPVMRKSPFAGMLFNGQGRPLNLEAPAPTLPASMGGNRTPIIDQLQLERGGVSWVVDYHRHLRAGGKPYDAIPERLRRITVEEAAAIQTFPHWMEWTGSQSARYRQIGNAVPPLLAYAVGKAVWESLGHGRDVTAARLLGL